MDMAEKLQFLDEKYLANFEEITVDSQIQTQKPFEEVKRVVKEYPISDSEKEEETAYLSLNMAVGDSLDKELYVGFQILDYSVNQQPYYSQ